MTSHVQSDRPAPLVMRLQRRVVERVKAEAESRSGTPAERYLATAEDHAARAAQRMTELRDIQAEHARVGDPDLQRELIITALRRQRAPARSIRAARRGWLDLDAYSERQERAAYDHVSAEAIALRLAAAHVTARLAPVLATVLADRLAGGGQAPLRCAAAEAIAVMASQVPLGEARHRVWPALDAVLALDTVAPRRVQAAAATTAWQIDRNASRALFARRLGARGAAEDDFIVRQYLVKLLGSAGADAASFAVVRDAARDPSEHVRLAVCDALPRTGGAAALPLLTEVARGGDVEPGPRVRGAALAALGRLARAGVAGALAEIAARLDDGDEIVARIASEELVDLAARDTLSEADAKDLAARAVACANQAPTAAGGDLALEVLEALASRLDRSAERAHPLLAPLRAIAPGATTTIRTDADPTTFGRLLARAARTGFGLYARPVGGGYRITHGARFVTRLWRVLHEARSPTPYKRQDGAHAIGRSYPGTLRAHARLLAEATPTIPGEPLAVREDGGWGAHLPTVDDLLSMPARSAREFALYSLRGVTRVAPPARFVDRVRARYHLTMDYSALAGLRNRALSPLDPSERTAYVQRLRALGYAIAFEPYRALGREAAPGAASAAFAAGGASALLGTAALFPDQLGELVQYAVTPSGNTLAQLAVAVAVAGAGLIAGNLVKREQIRHDRARIPLVVGGWGTRGKSGTERLKAALFHGIGAEVLVKTTGCEAMFIHGVPGRRPTEIFIHRSYDKATIWEQRDLLALAANLGVDVFLWECMALSPPLVRTLQDEWMRDDLSTITNAYPDHEDIQGPAGHDVARAIAVFIRSRGTVITSEDQMLPILAQEADRKRAQLIPVGWRASLLAEDLLARFPYHEHPRNIALVRRLAEELGLDADLATADMADHVVPDLGVLKAYPEARHRGRRLVFINGMSANERTGFLSNWHRMGCERPMADSTERGAWTVTIVNNRFDRVARSKVFAEILVRDATADRHILIGTNLTGLLKYVEAALAGFVQEIRLFRSDDAAHMEASVVAERLARVQHRLRVGPATADAVLGELGAWTASDVSALRPAVEVALASALAAAAQTTQLAPVIAAISATLLGSAVAEAFAERPRDELVRFVTRSLARRALVDRVALAAQRALVDRLARAGVDQRLAAIYRALFLDMLVSVPDPGATGDQVVDVVVGACPPGSTITAMGIQNIKGTGLDFVYCFLRLDDVTRLARQLAGHSPAEIRAACAALSVRTDWGILDTSVAVEALRAAAARAGDPELRGYLTSVAVQLEAIARRRRAALSQRTVAHGPVWMWSLEKALDALDAVRRRRRADAIVDALAHGEISHERAALEARQLVDREKKGWMRSHIARSA